MARRRSLRSKHLTKRQTKQQTERIQPTPERIAKGDLLFGEDKVFRSMNPTIIDHWAVIGRLGNVTDLVTITRRQSFARLHNIAMAAGIPGIKAMDLSDFTRHRSSTESDLSLEEITARDEFNAVMRQINDSRHRAILQHLCTDPDDEPSFSVKTVLDSLDELGLTFHRLDNLAA